VEHRARVDEARRLLDHEVAVAVDRHEGRDRGGLDVALHVVGRARLRDHIAGELLGGTRVGNEVFEAGVDALERGRLRVRYVAGEVLERERLRTNAGHRVGEGAEDTNALFSTIEAARAAIRGWPRKPRAKEIMQVYQLLGRR